MEEREKRIDALALKILNLSRNTLILHLSFPDRIISSLEFVKTERYGIFTDGKYLFYNPRYVIESYKNDSRSPVRDYLHSVLHCIFRHMYELSSVNRPLWDLAADTAVENIINYLDISPAGNGREKLQKDFIRELDMRTGKLTAERIYKYFQNKNITADKAAELRAQVYGDNHDIWYMSEERKFAFLGINPLEYERASEFVTGEKWRAAGIKILEASEGRAGKMPGCLISNLKEVTRERYDYGEFLKKFAVPGEALKINEDEFDNIFYTYGLSLYKNMPLAEPLEYKEVKRIREFVIAVDTSGSTSGKTVQSFINKTYNILKSTESFFSEINLRIIQCDAGIQQDVKIRNQQEFDGYIKNVKVHGMGGTDFRPVFTYVDSLIEKKEFINLGGLIYFTDGLGAFPDKKPSYKTAFVFVGQGNQASVPPWAIKLVLDEEEI